MGSSSSNNGTILTLTVHAPPIMSLKWAFLLEESGEKATSNNFELIKIIKEEEATTQMKMSQYQSGEKSLQGKEKRERRI